jgi:hypothetical protein
MQMMSFPFSTAELVSVCIYVPMNLSSVSHWRAHLENADKVVETFWATLGTMAANVRIILETLAGRISQRVVP